MSRKIRHPRKQGDLGEVSAIEWFTSQGACVYVPIGHSPNIDLVASIKGQLVGIQVKTSTYVKGGRWQVGLATRGGNQTWTGTVKRFAPERCDFLFVLVGDGRRWLIPGTAVGGQSQLMLGGPRYAAYEVECGRPLRTPASGGF